LSSLLVGRALGLGEVGSLPLLVQLLLVLQCGLRLAMSSVLLEAALKLCQLLLLRRDSLLPLGLAQGGQVVDLETDGLELLLQALVAGLGLAELRCQALLCLLANAAFEAHSH